MTSPIFTAAAELWSQMRAEYETYLASYIDALEAATAGNVANHHGRRKGVTILALVMKPESYRAAYGSRELREFMAETPRIPLEAYEADWLADHWFRS